MSVERGIFEELKRSCPEMIPMHMPGHKRRTDLAPYLAALGAGLDITEINGFDNLHDPHGLLQSAMERACALWGSRRAFFLVNGSTCGILAAVKTCCAFGGKILLGRNAHRSVYNAVDLFHLDPVYLAPETSVTGIPGRISPESVARALEREPEIQTVVITSPTYEGVFSDIASIARIVHGHGKTLIVDEAHGAHFGFGHGFPDSAVNQGADVVIHSLHKTLPSLTQTGIVHICTERVSPDALADALAVFETSSPSYLLMTSIDGCVSLLRQQGEKLFSAWENALDGFYHRCRTLEKLRILQGTDRDRSKILILTDRADQSGPELGERLRREHRIEPEMCLPDGVLAMTGMGDSEQTLTALSDALQQIDSSLPWQMGMIGPLAFHTAETLCPVAKRTDRRRIRAPCRERRKDMPGICLGVSAGDPLDRSGRADHVGTLRGHRCIFCGRNLPEKHKGRLAGENICSKIAEFS